MSTRLRSLAPLGTALIWGVNIPVMKGAIGHVHPFVFNCFRLTLSVLVLGLLARGTRATERPATTPWGLVVTLALFAGFLYQLLFMAGMSRTTAGHTAVLIGTSPIWTTLLARAIGMERPGVATWVGLVVAFAGMTLAVFDSGGAASLAGDALILAAAIIWAVSLLVARRTLDRVSPLRLAYLYALLALPAHWLVAWPKLEWSVVSHAPPSFWLSVLYSGVFGTGIAYWLFNIGLVAIGPARTSVFQNLVPIVGTLIAWSVLGESVSSRQLIGGSLVIAGLLMVQRMRARTAAA